MDYNSFKNILSCHFNLSNHRNFEKLSREIFESIPNHELFNVGRFNKLIALIFIFTGENEAAFNTMKTIFPEKLKNNFFLCTTYYNTAKFSETTIF